MVQFEEVDLFYNHYINTMGEYPDYIAIESLDILNLKEKFHVIFICDAYLKRHRLDKTVENFQKAEKVLKGCSMLNPAIKELYSYVLQNWPMSEEPVTESAF